LHFPPPQQHTTDFYLQFQYQSLYYLFVDWGDLAVDTGGCKFLPMAAESTKAMMVFGTVEVERKKRFLAFAKVPAHRPWLGFGFDFDFVVDATDVLLVEWNNK
jgi:hypothetical protein